MPNTRFEAIRQADEYLKAAGLPTYCELVIALRDGMHIRLNSRPRTTWIKRVSELLRKAGAA
jgi:hypothetical protein